MDLIKSIQDLQASKAKLEEENCSLKDALVDLEQAKDYWKKQAQQDYEKLLWMEPIFWTYTALTAFLILGFVAYLVG